MSLKEGMPIEFQLETLVKQEGEQESFLYEGMGQIVEMGNWLYLRYIEAETAVPVTFKLSREGKVTIIRRMEQTSRMTFDAEGKGMAMLPTPAGLMEIETITHEMLLEFKEKPFAGKVTLHYELQMNEQKLGDYRIELQFTT